ncbi:hypothetical protein BDZ91DRAFT_709077 [Kalaharituber pfeilii]|nr:hypothetical protein BDZ91DRAFT_709077 [Kalaharituber pfeilii]
MSILLNSLKPTTSLAHSVGGSALAAGRRITAARSVQDQASIFGNPRSRSRLINPTVHWQLQRWQSQQTGGGAAGGAGDYQLGPSNEIQPTPGTQHFGGDGNGEGGGSKGGGKGKNPDWKGTSFKMFEAAATTAASIAILGLAGYGYHKYYKHLVLKKIHVAFEPGDPVLELAAAGHDVPVPHDDEHWIWRKEQDFLNAIVRGDITGHYYLLVGEKGTGKTSMLLDAMRKIDGDRCSMLEAHADAEIFRSRLGKAIDFEYHEDYIGSLFSIRGPRETTPILDIERAFNKLEKVALAKKKEEGKPLILIINSMHLLRDDDEGRDILELLQQRAESWAATGLITMIFNSDDYWVYERLKQYGSRMEVISIKDLPRAQAVIALQKYRKRYKKPEMPAPILEQVYERVGGRLAFLNRVAKSDDPLKMCDEIIRFEKTWLLNQCGLLGSSMDDDVMNQQKYASSAMVLVKHLVELEQQQEVIYDPEEGHKLPQLPLYQARQVMTRAEFIQQYDHMNIFTIDSESNVRADSVPMQNAFRQVVSEPGFAQYLDDTLERIADIESLGRTREITIKDLWYGGKYNMTVKDRKGNVEKVISWDVEEGKRGGDGGDED